MVWAKLSDDFSDECAAVCLSDATFRTHVEGLLWVMRRANGPVLSPRDLRRCAEADDPEKAAAELVSVGFWDAVEVGWVIRHHMQYQPEPEVIRSRRNENARKQQIKRLRDAFDAAVRHDDIETRDALGAQLAELGAKPRPQPEP